LYFPAEAYATEDGDSCGDRYLTIINPVRGRSLWKNGNITSLENQYKAVGGFNMSATWLLQYDAIQDSEIIEVMRQFDENQEKGLFLEVSEDLAEDARVIYPHAVKWSNPGAVFLSGYAQKDRERIIDTLFDSYKKNFEHYPQSVGSWWVDSYSLNYMKEKYDIKAVLIVADQQTTDDYGVWGQWWGVPYYPSAANILVPPQNLKEKQNIVVLQWAQRDLSLAYGESPKYSNYSLQANDYLERGESIEYFKGLVATYLDCKMPISQITLGLETGMEGYTYSGEYLKQLEYLSNVEGLKAVTMSEFADSFSAVYPEYPTGIVLDDGDTTWTLSTKGRENIKLGDYQEYESKVSFPDYFVADKSSFLERRLSSLKDINLTKPWMPWYLLVGIILGIAAFKKKLMHIWLPGVVLAVSAFGLLLKSNTQLGWKVYYGPVFENLEAAQIIVVLLSFLLTWAFYKIIKNKRLIWILPLVFGLTSLMKTFRYTFFGGKYYFGLMVDALKFVGVSFSKLSGAQIVVRDFPSVYASALLRIGDNHIWGGGLFPIIIYIASNFVIACLVWKCVTRASDKTKEIIMLILVTLFIFHLISIINTDPAFVLPV
jgi:hypothetical protein